MFSLFPLEAFKKTIESLTAVKPLRARGETPDGRSLEGQSDYMRDLQKTLSQRPKIF